LNRRRKKAIIISISSDIGIAIAQRWLKNGWDIYGTYRNKSDSVEELGEKGVKLVHCDLSNNHSVKGACLKIKNMCSSWDNLILAPGTQEPVGPFENCDFNEWADSIQVNFTNQLRIVYELLHNRNKGNELGACVLFFAGGGTNSATENYSAYTISKIALIKMCELLDTEIPDVRFTIVGPGWVKTKIHEATLEAGIRAGDNYEKTKQKLNSDELTPMKDVIDCCDWLIDSRREIISARNFSVVFDCWGTEKLIGLLENDENMYKLRRKGNKKLVKNEGK
tara:strand:+ start:6129 stop:6968 length:840 start_codon:yes stop_codon:yes gene_type:complete